MKLNNLDFYCPTLVKYVYDYNHIKYPYYRIGVKNL